MSRKRNDLTEPNAGLAHEDPTKYEAFVLWFQERNVSEVSRKTGIPDVTLRSWRTKFKWDERAMAIDEEQRKQLDKVLVEQNAEFRAKMAGRVEEILDKAWDTLKVEGFVDQIESPHQLAVLVKLGLSLRGENVGERTRKKSTSGDSSAVDEAADRILKEIQGRVGKQTTRK